MKHLRKLLFPFAAIYYVVAFLRNTLYDNGVWQSTSYDFPLICIGNLSTGGTGKTPMTEYVIRLLKDRTSVGVLSRGYGRKTSGFIAVTPEHSALEVGDEPLQYATKFMDVAIAVCEDRRAGIQKMRGEDMAPSVIVLDDAYQHRKIKAGYAILLTSYDSLFSSDFVLPAGNLREARSGAKRAQAIIVTKCPANLSKKEREEIKAYLSKYASETVYFTSIQYDEMVCNERGTTSLSAISNKEITLVTGIANPTPLLKHLHEKNLIFAHKKYGDHHNFTTTEITALEKCACILTTEKDYMRLKSLVKTPAIYYLPIQVSFLDDGKGSLDKAILDFVNS